jgi:exonuclease SbcD
MPTEIRILLVADSHLGFDLPARPRVGRRRRGHDFLANHALALKPALEGEVDVVVHGGDVFDSPRISTSLAYQAYAPLLRVAERGVPVFVVPGNHERSRLPHARLLEHPHVHVFDRARTFVLDVRGTRVALAGLPFERRDVRTRFPALLEDTAWRSVDAALRVLCLHHCVEGATVGPGDFTFTSASDVIRLRDIPRDFAVVMSGHIHRQQVLTHDLRGGVLHAPVLYPGSVERTSLAEIGEPKGYMLAHLSSVDDRVSVRWEFRELPARLMLVEDVEVRSATASSLENALLEIVRRTPADAVLRIRVNGALSAAQLRVLSAATLRALAPATMNVEVRATALGSMWRAPADRRERSRRTTVSQPPQQLQLL